MCGQSLSRVSLKNLLNSGSGVQRGCGRCDGPGHPPWGIQRATFRKKNVVKLPKRKREMSLPGHDAALGASKDRIFVKFDS